MSIEITWRKSLKDDPKKYTWEEVKKSKIGSQFREAFEEECISAVRGVFMTVTGGVLIVYDGYCGIAIADSEYFETEGTMFYRVRPESFTITPDLSDYVDEEDFDV